MSEHNHRDWEPQRNNAWGIKRNPWDSRLLLVGGGALLVLILTGMFLWIYLLRTGQEDAPPPTVENTPAPLEVDPSPFEPLPVFLLLACAVGIWLLVILVAILTWLVWLRLPTSDDTQGLSDKIGKPPPT